MYDRSLVDDMMCCSCTIVLYRMQSATTCRCINVSCEWRTSRELCGRWTRWSFTSGAHSGASSGTSTGQVGRHSCSSFQQAFQPELLTLFRSLSLLFLTVCVFLLSLFFVNTAHCKSDRTGLAVRVRPTQVDSS